MLRKIHPAGRNVSVNQMIYADISTSRMEFYVALYIFSFSTTW